MIKNSMAFVGNLAEDTVKKFNADIFFFSSSSIDSNGIISDYSEEETALRQAMHNGAKISIFLFDSSKYGKNSAFRCLLLNDIDFIVTDKPLDENLIFMYDLKLIKSTNYALLYQRA